MCYWWKGISSLRCATVIKTKQGTYPKTCLIAMQIQLKSFVTMQWRQCVFKLHHVLHMSVSAFNTEHILAVTGLKQKSCGVRLHSCRATQCLLCSHSPDSVHARLVNCLMITVCLSRQNRKLCIAMDLKECSRAPMHHRYQCK